MTYGDSTVFGDSVPEDAWDRGDPIPVLLHNLDLRVAALGELRIIIDPSPLELLEDIRRRLGRVRLRQLDDDQKHRVEMIVEDIEFVLGRLEEDLYDDG